MTFTPALPAWERAASTRTLSRRDRCTLTTETRQARESDKEKLIHAALAASLSVTRRIDEVSLQELIASAVTLVLTEYHSSPPDSIIQPAFHRLTELGRLTPDWDTYGGEPPTRASLATAYALLFEVAERFGEPFGERVRPFAIVPLAAGGVQIEWRQTGAEVELEIGPGGDIAYLFIDKRGADRVFQEKDSVSWDEALEVIARVLASDHAR